MARTYLPLGDDALLAWSLNFSTLLTANFAAYGIPQAVANTYSSKYNTYKAALAAAQQPQTRGVATVLAKKTAKDDLVGYTRIVARTIVNNMTTTNAQRQALGLIVRKKPSRQPAPTVRPGMDVVSVFGRTIYLSLHDSSSGDKRAKPNGVAQALVYYFAGEEYPSDPNGWSFAGPATRSKFDFAVPDSIPGGTRVWVCAAWTNRAGEPGPTNVPVSVNIQGGGVQQPAQPMKLAA